MTLVVNVKVPSSLAPRLKLPMQDNATGFAEVGDGWEVVALPLGAAWLVGVAWLLCSAWVRKQCRRREAWLAVDDFGVPLWRCATGMWTQLLVLPTLFALSLACANFSLTGWVDAAGAAWFTVNGQRFWDWCFCYVFAGGCRRFPSGRILISRAVCFRVASSLAPHPPPCPSSLTARPARRGQATS
jgi:hypothetical protein